MRKLTIFVFIFWSITVFIDIYGFGSYHYFLDPCLHFIASLSTAKKIALGFFIAFIIALGLVVFGIWSLSKTMVDKTPTLFKIIRGK